MCFARMNRRKGHACRPLDASRIDNPIEQDSVVLCGEADRVHRGGKRGERVFELREALSHQGRLKRVMKGQKKKHNNEQCCMYRSHQ